MNEDEWDSNDDVDEQHMLSKEWKRVENGLEKDGYRQGLEFSQEIVMQDGFDQAFNKAITMALHAGRLQGGICGRVSWNSKGPNETTDSENTSAITTQPLEHLSNDISSLISEIPYILSAKKSCSPANECLCSVQSSESTDNDNSIQNYWSRLGKLQEKAEKEDENLDSSFISQV